MEEKIIQLLTEIKELLKTKEPKATLTITECVEYTSIGRDKLMELAHSETAGFPAFRVGTKFLVNRELLDMWLENIAKEKRVL